MGLLDFEEKTFDLREMKDEEILALSIKHPHAFEAIIDRYEAAFLRKARSILYTPEEAEDIVQEAFTKIYINAHRYKVQPGASFNSWAYRILINTAFTRYQKIKREKGARRDLDPEVFEGLGDVKSRDFEKLEVAEYVFSILSRLPEHLARVLRLHILEGRPQEEVAKIEGISVGAVKTRVHRAKKAFKDNDTAVI
jgi:RNA polymerase sigma-70 factor (ECF subfamily)